MNTESRFFVDERSGCIAVRDRTLTNPDDQGLHYDTHGVVWYRHGKTAKRKCPTCGHEQDAGWELDAKDIAEAQRIAAEMNAKAAADEKARTDQFDYV